MKNLFIVFVYSKLKIIFALTKKQTQWKSPEK